MTTKLQADFARTMQEYKGWFFALGALLVLTGTAAIILPHVATLSIELFAGGILLVASIFQIIHAFSAKNWMGFAWELLMGIIYLVGGVFMITNPLAGILALTIILAATFVAEGAVRAVLALRIRPNDGWGWLLLGGIVSILVGLMIFAKFPSSALWAIGLLVGINFVMAGWSFIMLPLAAKRIDTGESGTSSPQA